MTRTRKHLAAVILLAASALLVVAAIASAAQAVDTRDTSRVIPSAPGAVWMIKLKGARVRQLTYRDFALYQATHAATYLDNLTDPANPVTYSGVDLKALVGLVDDNHPRMFNEALATTAPGYVVRVVGADGFAHDFASADVAAQNIVVSNRVTAAGAPLALPLPFGTAKYKSSTDSVGFSPAWPLKLVGSFLTSGTMKVGGINLIVLRPVPTPPRAAAQAVDTRDTSRVIPSAPGAVWMIKLKGARVRQLTYRDFALYQATHAATYLDNLTDPANPVTYSGVDLKALVGLVDDNHPRMFNEALATTAPGYVVRVVGADGFAHDFASADVAAQNIVVSNRVTAAGAPLALPLPFGTAKYKSSTDSVGFSPAWPLKLVGSFLTSGTMKVGGINLIVLRPVPTP